MKERAFKGNAVVYSERSGMNMYISVEQQEAVEAILGGQNVMVNGCAGSQKTQTLVHAGLQLFAMGRNVLFVTLVGSVTAEIVARCTRQIDAKFVRRGNHYMCEDGSGGRLEVANLDAVIHKRLVMEDLDMSDLGDQFDMKCEEIIERNCRGLYHCDGELAHVVFWDEIQDAPPSRVKVMIQLISSGPTSGVAAGDYLQTIFADAAAENDHPMRMWERDLQVTRMPLSTCFRCPKEHIAFRNVLMRPFDKHHHCVQITSSPRFHRQKNPRPILFAHGPLTSSNCDAADAAKVLFNGITALLAFDTSLELKDVVVLMTRSNDNPLFTHLESLLNSHYGCVAGVILNTERNGDRSSIRWDKVKDLNAVKMSSIHAFKGLGAEVIFVLGVTEGSLPRKERLFHTDELVDHSLLNVTMTRSTRYLFVGFAQRLPSRYVRDAIPEISKEKLAAFAWDNTTWETGHERVMCPVLANGRQPQWYSPHYLKAMIHKPARVILDAGKDVAEAVSHPRKLLRLSWNSPTQVAFGQPWNAPEHVTANDVLLPIVGYMGELLVKRALYGPSEHPTQYNLEHDVMAGLHVRYTPDKRELDIVYDLRLNDLVKDHARWRKALESYIKLAFNKQNEQWREVGQRMLIAGPQLYLDEAFDSKNFRESLKSFMSAEKACALRPNAVWNVAMMHAAASTTWHRPNMMTYMDFFGSAEGLVGLVKNAEGFAAYVAGERLILGKEASLLIREDNEDICKDMGCDVGLSLGVVGKVDGISESGNDLYEFKTSSASEPQNNWKMQVLTYATIGEEQVRNIHIVNLARGVMYTWKLPVNFHRKGKAGVVKKLCEFAKFRPEHVEKLVKAVCNRFEV